MSRSPTAPIRRVLLIGGTSEIGLAAVRALRLPEGGHVILAGRDDAAQRQAAGTLPSHLGTTLERFDARDPESVAAVVDRAFAAGPVDLVLPAFGVLGDQQQIERQPALSGDLLTVNVVSQTRALLEAARSMRHQGHGVIVALSSVAAVRARRANFVYGSSKAALDAVACGLADSLHGTGVDVVLVRPGFVIGRMTAGMSPAPLAVTPEVVGAAVADAVQRRRTTAWVPAPLAAVAWGLRLAPRPLWRRVPR